jgi:predicted dehydrogenase
MAKEMKVAIIGLDTSHSIEFARRIQAPDCPKDQQVSGMKVVSCLRFGTPFQNEEGLNGRQKQLEDWGIEVSTDFKETVKDCEAILIEINDPAYHLEYFKKCADLGKPMFLDKPLADNIKNGQAILDIVRKKKARVFSSSSSRFLPQLSKSIEAIPQPLFSAFYGPLGIAPAGSSIVWYGVHAFEMLERAMGRGAQSLTTVKDASGVTVVVDYSDKRTGVVELVESAYVYGGVLRTKDKSVPFVADMGRAYTDLLVEIGRFFAGGRSPVDMEDTQEVMAMLDAAERSRQSGKKEAVKS